MSELNRATTETLSSILDGMHLSVYVTDLENDEMLFANNSFKKGFAIEDINGKKCWQLLKSGATCRCDNCPVYKLEAEPAKAVVWEDKDERTGKTFKKTDSLIRWHDGRLVHMQCAEDISKEKREAERRKRQSELQKFMFDISGRFMQEAADLGTQIDKALKKTGEFLKADRLVLSEQDKENGKLSFVSEWRSKRVSGSLKGETWDFLPGTGTYERVLYKSGKLHTVGKIEDESVRARAEKLGIKRFIDFHVFMGDEFYGALHASFFERETELTAEDESAGHLCAALITVILQRKRLQSRMLRMAAVAENTPLAALCIDRKGDFVYFNKALENITGFSSKELNAKGIKCLLGEEKYRSLIDVRIPELLDKEKSEFDFYLTTKDRKDKIVSCTMFKTDDADNIGVIAADITQKSRTEEELVRAKEAAEQVNLAKSEFLMNLSHEMRTPLNAIIGMANIAKSAEDDKKKEYCLQKVDNAAKHLLAIINDILDITKIEASELELSETEFSFEDMLFKAVNVVNFGAEEKGQNLIVTLDPQIDSKLLADEMRLSQVITNLLANAVKFTHDYGVIKVNARKLKEDKQTITLKIEVADNGIGISEEHRKKLFQPFVQAEGGTKKNGGTGLGLAICKRIVELMDGEIGVNSTLGEGSTFWFTVRLKKGKKGETIGAGLGINRSNLSILVIDESADTREYFLSVLGLAELSCDTAATAGEALTKLKRNGEKPYNVIFIGDGLKEISAAALTKKIKEAAPGGVVILITSHTKWGEIEEQAKDAGISKYIVRPMFPSLIINSINEVIGTNGSGSFSKGAIKNRFDGNNILIVEDIDVNREIMMSLIEDTGVLADTAHNGVQAISRLKENPDKYDLILMDIHMPDMDGHKATKIIRGLENKRLSNIPIVAMTANVFKEDIEKCMQSGMNGHIGKPIDPDELLMILTKYLKKSEKTEPADEIRLVKKRKPVIYEELLPELDIKEGLSRLMNNKKLYVNLLKGFSGRKMTDELKSAVLNNDYNKCVQVAQALKSVSMNLGLERLASITAAIEASGRESLPMADRADELEEIAAKTISAIETLLKGEL